MQEKQLESAESEEEEETDVGDSPLVKSQSPQKPLNLAVAQNLVKKHQDYMWEIIFSSDRYKSLPFFVKKKHILDSEKRSPEHPEYDPSTLFIPPSEVKTFTPAMQQFWRMK